MAITVKPVLVRSFQASVALTRNRFITATGAVPAAGGNAIGIAATNAAIGEMVAVTMLGPEGVEAGGAIAVGAAIESDAQGRAVARTTGVAIARALTAASAAGQLIEVALIPN